MTPELNHNDYLPPGIHAATPDEIATRFSTEPELRRVQMESPGDSRVSAAQNAFA